MQQWAKGAFQSEDVQTCAMANSQAVGQVRMLDRILEVDFNEFNEAMKNG